MFDALIKGMITMGLQYYELVKKEEVMEDYDAGVKEGKQLMLDAIMKKLVSHERWEKAKKDHDHHIEVFGIKDAVTG